MPSTNEPTNETGRTYPKLPAAQRKAVLQELDQLYKEGLFQPKSKVVSIQHRRKAAQEGGRVNTPEE